MIEYRVGRDRFRTEAEGRTTWHSFSFGAHYDPGNVGFGSLVAHNDELLPPGTGYAEHPHADLEIVTWVLDGALRHTSSVGSAVVGPGQVQRLSAGSGVVHSEVADGHETTRFLQAWVRPDESGLVPGYVPGEVSFADGWTCVADGDGQGVVPISARGTSLNVAELGLASATTSARGAAAARVRGSRTGAGRRTGPGPGRCGAADGREWPRGRCRGGLTARRVGPA